jgi:hypothetical protein
MMRTMGLALALGLWIATGVLPHESVTPPACKLLTAQEASQMMGGMALTVNPNDAARLDFNCRYNPSPTSFNGVEITYRTFPNSQAAHTYFPRWVIPVPPMPADMEMHPVSGVGDEAAILTGRIAKGIYFRRGAVLLKMGTNPPGVATDSALVAAAQTMIGRM